MNCVHPIEALNSFHFGGVNASRYCSRCGRHWEERDLNGGIFTRAGLSMASAWHHKEQHSADWSSYIEHVAEHCWMVVYLWTPRSFCATRAQARAVISALKGFE